MMILEQILNMALIAGVVALLYLAWITFIGMRDATIIFGLSFTLATVVMSIGCWA